MISKLIDKRLNDIGFEKIEEDDMFVAYRRWNEVFGYWHRLDLIRKTRSCAILQSYDESNDAVDGLSVKETILALLKIKAKGWR